MKKEYSCLFDKNVIKMKLKTNKNVMNPYLGTTIANWVHRIFLRASAKRKKSWKKVVKKSI